MPSFSTTSKRPRTSSYSRTSPPPTRTRTVSSSSHFPDREVESLSLLVFRRHRSKSIPGPGQQQAEESLIEMPAQQLADTKGAKAKIVSATATAIPYNPSSQHLMKTNELSELDLPNHDYIQYKTATSRTPHHITKRQWLTVTILFFVNLINYMDRLTIAGILSKIQNTYNIGDAEGGALQTAFVVSYMIFAPIFGYLGDRQSRKAIMAFGVFLWAIFTLIGSFMPTYEWFLICRAMVGIGEASYSTIAPTIISDMFVKDVRSKMLAFFYFAIPVGSGMGYVVGAKTTLLAGGDWRYGLRVTPFLGVIAVFLILFLMDDPPRGESEGHGELKPTTYTQDIKCLGKNKSFIFSTIAFTCVTFCTGALSWWGPKYIEAAVASSMVDDIPSISMNNISLVFGIVTMMSGIVGVPLGSILSTKLKQKYPRADPVICAVGILTSSAFLAAGVLTASFNIYLAFFVLFLGEVALNLNWSIVADILLYVVVPTRRSTAEALQILISHALGDAGSPYLIGIVSDALRSSTNTTVLCDAPNSHETIPTLQSIEEFSNKTRCDFAVDYTAMQYSLLINNVVEIIGGLFFLITAIYIIKDKLRCDRYVAENEGPKKSKFNLDSNAYPPQVFKGESESVSTDEDDDTAPQLQLILSPDVESA